MNEHSSIERLADKPESQNIPETHEPQDGANEKTTGQMIEAGQSSSPGAQVAAPSVLPTPLPQDDHGVPGAQQSAPLAPLANMPAIADDSDLIEKEWVMRAKHIVEQTRSDPYVQSQEVNKMKADYIKKRYGKDMKLSS